MNELLVELLSSVKSFLGVSTEEVLRLLEDACDDVIIDSAEAIRATHSSTLQAVIGTNYESIK